MYSTGCHTGVCAACRVSVLGWCSLLLVLTMVVARWLRCVVILTTDILACERTHTRTHSHIYRVRATIIIIITATITIMRMLVFNKYAQTHP